MARNPKKRQKNLQRKAAKRKQKKAKSRQFARPGGQKLVRQSGNWPVHEVWLTEDWDKEGNIIQALVARKSEQGQLVMGAFVVDLGCLGVKNAYARPVDVYEYREVLDTMKEGQSMVKADINLVAKVIREGIAYARRFDLEPHRDYFQAKPVLGDADPDACSVPVPLGGPEGKPFFISGPYDNVDKIMAKLTKAVGPDGFHYVTHLSPDTEIFLDDDDWEEV